MRVAAFLEPGRSLEDGIEEVRLAEELGYDSVWVTHIAAREPLQLLNLYAHHTERIGLGTGVVTLALRHPALLAMEAATVDEMAGGRVRLGIGVGHRLTIEGWYGMKLHDPVGAITEYTRILRQIFDKDGVTFEGEHYTARFGFLGYGARRGLPVLWAALGPRMLRAATEYADGVVLWMCSPSHIQTTIRPAIDAGLAEVGRSPDEFEVIAAVPAAVTEDLESAHEAFRAQVFPYLNLPFYRKEVAAAHPQALATFDERLAVGDMIGAFAAIGPDVVDDFAGIGDRSAVRNKLQEYRDAGVTLPAVAPLPRGPGWVLGDVLRAAAPD